MKIDELLEKIQKEEQFINEMSSVIYIPSESSSENKNNKFFNKYSDEKIKILTNFTKEEVYELFIIVSDEYYKIKSTRGRKCKLSDLDMFFMLLVYLKVYENFNLLGDRFGISASTTTKYLTKMIATFSSIFYNKFVCFYNKTEQEKLGIIIEDFKDVGLIIDCSVQPVPRYLGGLMSQRNFFLISTKFIV